MRNVNLRVPMVAIAAMACLASGCSWIGVRSPSPRGEPLTHCTTSVAAPVLDTIMAILGGVLVAGGIAVASEKIADCDGCFRGVGILFGVVPGVLITTTSTASAAHGYSATAECRERQIETEVLLSGVCEDDLTRCTEAVKRGLRGDVRLPA